MKKSYVVVMNMEEQGAILMHEEPTHEFLTKHLGDTWTMIRLQPGVELYCDDDGRAKGLLPRCVAMWRKWPHLPPVPQIIRGPAVFVMRSTRSSRKAMEKISMAVRSEFPVNVELKAHRVEDRTVH